MEFTQIMKYLQNIVPMDFPQLMNHFQNIEKDMRRQVFSSNETASDFVPPRIPLEQIRVGGNQTMSLLRNQEHLELPNPFQLSDNFFSFCFIFEKQLAEEFLLELSTLTFHNPHCDFELVPFDLRILAALSFLKHGNLDVILPLDAFRLFRPNVLLHCVPKVCQQIVHFLTPSLVRYPNSHDELNSIKNGFLQQFGLPGIVGVLDCFFVRLRPQRFLPQHQYVNRSGHTSINVQLICDRNLRFLDVNARFSGRSSDMHIWKHSNVRHMVQHQQAKNPRTWIVADRGYRLEGYLMNPYRKATTPTQLAINARLREVHAVLDLGVALLKARFQCLVSELKFNHQNCANIITACVTLHNYLIEKSVPIGQNIASLYMPKRRDLPNALYEENSLEGRSNRLFLENFLLNNPLQQLLDTIHI